MTHLAPVVQTRALAPGVPIPSPDTAAAVLSVAEALLPDLAQGCQIDALRLRVEMESSSGTSSGSIRPDASRKKRSISRLKLPPANYTSADSGRESPSYKGLSDCPVAKKIEALPFYGEQKVPIFAPHFAVLSQLLSNSRLQLDLGQELGGGFVLPRSL